MSFRRSIRFRRNRKRVDRLFDLQLTSMMDILVIILVFMLRSYAVSTNNFSSVPGIQIPYSISQDLPPDSLHVIVTPEAITFENLRVLDFVQTADAVAGGQPTYAFKPTDLDEAGRRVVPLFDALVKAREASELLRAKSKYRDKDGNPLPFDGVLAIQADKRVNYEVLRKVMYTAGTAGYRIFRFLAMRRET